MKRIVAVFTDKLDQIKRDRKIHRILRELDIAEDNAKDLLDELDIKKTETVESLPSTEDHKSIIFKLSELMDQEDEQKEVLKRLDAIRKYLNEDIKVEE